VIPQYKPDYFTIEELVPESVFQFTKPATLWNIFDHRILITADRLRKRYGKLLANTWLWGGRHNYRGYRPQGCSVGSVYSQHRFGRAIDLEPVDVTAEEIRQDILSGISERLFEYITAIELGTSWLHIDCRSHLKAVHGVLTFQP